MHDVSERWAPALASSHGIEIQVDILYGGTTVAENIPIVDGSVSVDRGSDVRRSLSLTVPDPSVFPRVETDPYAPYGQQLYVRRGVRYLDGSVEWVPLGFFVLEEIEGDVHTGPLSIVAPGLESLIQAQPFLTATSTHLAPDVNTFLFTQLNEVIPGVSYEDRTATAGSSPIATASWDMDADRWSALQQVARSHGCELFVDTQGTFVLADIPDPLTATIDWTVNAGDGGVMVSAERGLSADGVFNRVVARGGNVSDNVPPVSAAATVTDALDPLRYGGPFGRRTYSYQSELIVDVVQAQRTADALLRAVRAPNSTLTVESVPNPALDAGDCIRVVYGNGRPPELHIVQSFTVPLTVGGAFEIKTRSGREEMTT